MELTTSADGTPIAFERIGTGPPVVLVTGALSTAVHARPLAEALAALGLQGVCYDRRGRGSSGDTTAYAPEREIEDLRAVVGAVGGAAAIFGHSSGAVLALAATAAGVPTARLFASEPPLRFGRDAPPADLAGRLQALVDDGRDADAVLLFQRENVRLDEAQVAAFVAEPVFPQLVELARTTVYDTAFLAASGDPTPALVARGVPTTIVHGDPAAPVLVAACTWLAGALPGAELVIVRESHDHAVDPAATARLVRDRISAGRP